MVMCGFKLVITLASVLMRSSVVFPEGKALSSQEQRVFPQKKLISTNGVWKGEVAVEVLGSDYGEKGHICKSQALKNILIMPEPMTCRALVYK